MSDAPGDLDVVVNGAGKKAWLGHGGPREVFWSNMSKLGEDRKPIYNECGKIVKGPTLHRAELDSGPRAPINRHTGI
ncbi:hypothetical protein J2S92_003218 [Arthrobacter bambusae]|nr:hypothetical protein [Arthrobacter bambusae]MDQ0235963.1 hypothetical protein [Arthrobacter bambusae]